MNKLYRRAKAFQNSYFPLDENINAKQKMSPKLSKIQ